MPILCSAPRTVRGPAGFVLPLNSNSRRWQAQGRIQGVKSKSEKTSSLDIDVFETIGTDKDTSKFEPFSNGLNLFRNIDTSEPVSFDGQEKVEFDPLRDGPLRYLGYSNELGEAFSAWLFPGGVSLSYAVAIGYVLFDTWDKYTKTLTEAEEALGARRLPGVVDKDRLVSIIGLERGVDTLVWQLLASVILPGYTIHTVVGISSNICNRVLESSLGDDLFSRLGDTFMLEPASLQNLSEKSLPTVLGLLAIPFIVHPIDSAVHGILNATLRKQLRKYICIQGKGAQAGLPICEECLK